jgi:hypothetical protein
MLHILLDKRMGNHQLDRLVDDVRVCYSIFMKAGNMRLTTQALGPRGSVALVSTPKAFFFGIFAT